MTKGISQEDVESALDYLATSAKQYAEAKGRRVWLEGKLKIVKAEAFSAARSRGRSVADAEAEAYQSAAYVETTNDLRDAVIAEETARAWRGAADAKIEVFRTLESSRRAANV